jgi:hypothetical protein
MKILDLAPNSSYNQLHKELYLFLLEMRLTLSSDHPHPNLPPSRGKGFWLMAHICVDPWPNLIILYDFFTYVGGCFIIRVTIAHVIPAKAGIQIEGLCNELIR